MGFPKEYTGINKVLDGTDHDVQELKRALSADAKRSTAIEAMSPASLFVSQVSDCNIIYITNRPSEIEQKRQFFDIRSYIAEAVFGNKSQGIYMSMSASFGA